MAGVLAARQLPWAALFASLVGCTPAHAPVSEPAPSGAPAADATPACPIPEGALAWSGADDRCGFALVDGGRPRLVELTESREWPVQLPGRCVEQACDYALAETSLGALIVAALGDPSGETPAWVGLGIPLEGGYRFVDLWVGESVLDELTPAGPVHALAPHDCGGTLALLVVPRLGGASDEAPDPALLAAVGTPRLVDDRVVFDAVVAEDCTPLPVALP